MRFPRTPAAQILPLRVGDPQDRMSYVAIVPTCGPPRRRRLIPHICFHPRAKRWGPSRWHGSCSPVAHMWAPKMARFGTEVYFHPYTKRCGPPRWHGLCSHFAHIWARETAEVEYPLLISTAHKALGTPEMAYFMQRVCPHVALRDGKGCVLISMVILAPSVGAPRDGRGYVATLHTCGPPRR